MSVLVFDLDGTLVSSMDDLAATLNVILTRHGHSAIPPQNVKSMIGHGAKVLLQRGLEFNNVAFDDETIAPLYEEFLTYYEAHIADYTRPFPGVIDALVQFKAEGWKLAVCTNKVERLTLPLLEALDLTKHFDAIVGGDTFSQAKPNAEPVLGTIERAASMSVAESPTMIEP